MNKVLEKIYNYSPSFVQNIGVSLYGLKLYRREYGRKFEQALEEFEKSQWYSPDQLREYQEEKLRTLIKHCYDNVPYYRTIMNERKLKPADIQSARDLPKLPVLTREDIRRNQSSLLAANFKRSQLHQGHTSGTTDVPLDLTWDDRICLIKNAIDWRQKRWAGLNVGDRIAFFLGRVVVPVNRRKPPFWRHNWILNHLFCSSFHMSPENLDTYVEKLISFHPQAFEGFPSAIYILARFLLSTNKTFPVKAVLTSSESLIPHQREVIEQAFECKVFDFYGMAERVIFAAECQSHEGKHVNMDFGITELLAKDRQPVAVGEMGRIVATSLHSYAMPLVRYVTSDVTAIKPRGCSCGRHFPLMEDVTSKDMDIITTRDGRYLSPSTLTRTFKPMHSVEEWQIMQKDIGHLGIKIVKRLTYQDKDTQYILDDLRMTVGDGIRLEIEFVESIPRTKGGKLRTIISKVPLEF